MVEDVTANVTQARSDTEDTQNTNSSILVQSGGLIDSIHIGPIIDPLIDV